MPGIKSNILAEKQRKLTQLANKADKAVDMVTKTISNLEEINRKIDESVAEIDEYNAKLAQTREAMRKNRLHNAAIIANFSKLLFVDEQ